MAEPSTACSCTAMQIFSTPLDPTDLKKSADVSLSRNVPMDPSGIADQINGVRDNSLNSAQTTMVGVSLTQQKLNTLPDSVKSQSQVLELNNQLSAMQTEIGTQTAETYALGAQLTEIEESKKTLLSQKERLEEKAKAASGVLGATNQEGLTQTADYQAIQTQLSELDNQYAALQTQYLDARTHLDNLSKNSQGQLPSISQNLDALLQQYNAPELPGIDLQMPELPSTPATPGFPAMPTLPAMPAIPEMPDIPTLPSFPSPEGVEWIKLPALPATPELPAMPAFPGLPEGLPEVPSTSLDGSANSFMESADNELLSEAGSASTSSLNLDAIKAYFPSDAMQRANDIKSALINSLEGYMTPFLDAIPPLPERPELPAFPATADLTPFAGMSIPTKESLQQFGNLFSPEEYSFFSAVWTNVEAKQVAAQRAADAIKEQTAGFQTRIIELVDAQKAALKENLPLAQYLEKTSGKNPIFNALESQQVPDFMKKFSTLPETPTVCPQNCSNSAIRSLFPDVTNTTQMDVASLFANGKELVSTNTINVISVGSSSADFVNGHIANLESRIKEAGGKTTTLLSDDISSALSSPAGMIDLEDKLNGVSMVTLADMKDLSPQESALMSEISQKMSASVPVIITTPSIGTLSTDPKVNSAMINQLAPGGSTVDARMPNEVPQTSVYTASADSDSKIRSLFKA